MALTRTPIDPSVSEPAMPVSPEKSGAPSDSISAIPEYNRQNPICHAPAVLLKNHNFDERFACIN